MTGVTPSPSSPRPHMTVTNTLSVSPVEDKLHSFEFPPSSSTQGVGSQAGAAVAKKTRRQTAYYPHMNSSNRLQKPFSRSAAKRESVMALGSIEHLQHYFTKTGIAAKQDALKETKGLVPAIGSTTNRPLRPSLSSIQEFHLPPSPAVPVFNRSPYPSIERTYEVDPENLKPGVIRDLEAVAESWALAGNEGKLDEQFDVLSALRLTTQLIRSVRNYCVSLPDESIALQPNKQHFRPSSLQPVPMKRVTSYSNGASDPMARIRKLALEVLSALRALEENARLPLSDEAYDAQSDRVSSQGTRSPEPIQAVLENDELQQRQSPALPQGHDISFAVSVVTVPGRPDAVPVWDDEDEDDLKSEEGEKRDIWDERLVLGGGWLYRQDIHLTDLSNERDIVGKYLDAVDEALFDGPSSDGSRGWERAARLEREREAKGRRTSLGRHRDDISPLRPARVVSEGVVEAMSNLAISEETESPEQSDAESVDEDDLPEWAKRNTFADDPLARAHALLTNFLPVSLLPLLPIPYKSRLELLTALSSGQLLCVAYNVGIRRSRKMWGYINKDAVHDIATLEQKAAADENGGEATEKRTTGWTFRRIDNLRLWAAALKLRYLIPLTIPAAALSTQQPSITPSSTLTGSTSHDSLSTSRPITPTSPARTQFIPGKGEVPLIGFDAKLVARHEDGWETMLETVLLEWVRAVVEERRSVR